MKKISLLISLIFVSFLHANLQLLTLGKSDVQEAIGKVYLELSSSGSISSMHYNLYENGSVIEKKELSYNKFKRSKFSLMKRSVVSVINIERRPGFTAANGGPVRLNYLVDGSRVFSLRYSHIDLRLVKNSSGKFDLLNNGVKVKEMYFHGNKSGSRVIGIRKVSFK